MQKRHFEMETDGFYGAYWKCKTDSDCAMIAMIGDDSEDYLARTSVKWLHKLGVNVMTMSPAKICCITFEKLILMSKSQEGGQSETVQEENDSKDI